MDEFKPFDRVLVRNSPREEWRATFYSRFKKGAKRPHVCAENFYVYCIPYEGNENLLGESDTLEKQDTEWKEPGWFDPFKRVLVRDRKDDFWVDTYCFYHYEDDTFYIIGGGNIKYVIPYEGNEHLAGTRKDPEKKYEEPKDGEERLYRW